MPTENVAVQPTPQTSGLIKLTASPQGKPLVDNLVKSGSTAAKVESTTQTYMDRIRNYVPLEVIGFFIFVNAMVADDVSSTSHKFVAIASIFVSLAAVVIFTKMANAKADTQVWAVQAATSCVAFLVWAYAIGAAALDIYPWLTQDSVIAAFLLATFSLFSGLIVPVKKTA